MIQTNRVYTAVQSFLNKDQRSSIKPTQYNAFSAMAIADIIDEARRDIQNIKLGISVGRNDNERLKYAREIIEQFYLPTTISKSGNSYPHPSDLESIDKIYNGNDEVHRIREAKHLKLLTRMGKHFSPDNEDARPNYYYVNSESNFMVYPQSLADDLTLYYYRKYKAPRWTYIVVNNTPLYDGSSPDLQDFELPERCFDNLVLKIALYSATSIRDAEAMQAAFQMDREEAQEESN